MLSLTKKALEEFDNQHDFERMCADVLNALGYKNVTPIAPRGGSDGGRDITFTTETDGKGLACVTLRKYSEIKFKEDFEQRKSGDYEKYYFFTNQYLTSSQKLNFAKFCVDELNAELVVQDIEALRSFLDSSLQGIRKRFLHLDDDASAQVRKHITKILKYPATLSANNFQDKTGIAERMMTKPFHREIYYYVNDIDDEELQEIPVIGMTLHRLKEKYYNLCLRLNGLTEKCKEIISTQTVNEFQFIHGWVIYFNYFFLRAFGNTVDRAKMQVSVNYGISYENCETVFNLLRETDDISEDLSAISSEWAEISDLFTKLTEGINQLNSK